MMMTRQFSQPQMLLAPPSSSTAGTSSDRGLSPSIFDLESRLADCRSLWSDRVWGSGATANSVAEEDQLVSGMQSVALSSSSTTATTTTQLATSPIRTSPIMSATASPRMSAFQVTASGVMSSSSYSAPASPRASFAAMTPMAAAAQFSPSEAVSHIFVDNGNVFVGAQSLPNNTMDLALRLNVKQFATLLEKGRVLGTREVAASRPSNPRICSTWKKIGYNVHNDGVEASARQLLSERITTLLDDTRWRNRPNILVLATGDGNFFPSVVLEAVQRGWAVEVWSWSRCLSEKFKKLAVEESSALMLKSLDSFREAVTFRAPERSESEECLAPLDTSRVTRSPRASLFKSSRSAAQLSTALLNMQH